MVDEAGHVLNKSKPKYLSDLVHDDDIPKIVTSKNAQYRRLDAIGSVSAIICRFIDF